MELSSIRFKIMRAITYAAAIAVIFITGVTVTADLYLPLKNWLKITFSHHWIGKGVLAGMLFIAASVILSLFPAPEDEMKIKSLARSIGKLVIISIIGTIIITAFFYYEAFLKH